MKKVLFIKNALVLTVTTLILRCVGMFFRVWLAGAIGAEGIGLYQVIFSVYLFASTFATTGICTAVTRITTERLAVGDKVGAKRTVKVGSLISLLIATFTSAIIITFAKPIAEYLVGDPRAEASLKILCIGLPFMGVCSCIRGYFLARRNAVFSSMGQVVEQIVRIAIIVFLVGKYAKLGPAYTSAAVLVGDAAGEGASALLAFLLYKVDFKSLKQKCNDSFFGRKALKELLRISVPIFSGRYLHTGLRMVENLITPNCFSRFGGSKSLALEQFGMIKGMALPLLLFPASLLSSVSTLLIPEITESVTKGDTRVIKAAADKVFYITGVFSFAIAGLFFSASNQIGLLLYGSDSVGYLVRALAPLVPFMYIDLIADGVLKGLDQQNFLLCSNVTDSAIRIILVLILVPRFGMLGFLGVMLFSNLFTAIMSSIKIVKITKIKFNLLLYMFKPLLASFSAFGILGMLCKKIAQNNILCITVYFCGGAILYFALLGIFGGIKGSFLKDKIVEKSSKKHKKV